MKTNPLSCKRGFTLIEVLVVIAILVTLGTLVFMGVGKAMEAAHRAQSISNIKQLSSITVADAGDNNGVFPEIHFGNVPFWFSQEWREKSGITRNMAYSASNKCWTRGGMDTCSSPQRDLWDYGQGEESSIFSYACLIQNPIWTATGVFVEPDNWDRIKDEVVDEDEVVRWTPSRLGQTVAYPILWIDVTARWNEQMIGNYLNGDEPGGTHLGFLDGHVEWVRGNDMVERFSSPGLALFW